MLRTTVDSPAAFSPRIPARGCFRILCMALSLCLALPLAAQAVGVTGGLTLKTFTSLAFSSPMQLLQSPTDPDRWFVVERAGTVQTFATGEGVEEGEETAELWIDISRNVTSVGEGGLVGMALPPDFPTTRLVYLAYTEGDYSMVSRFVTSDDGLTVYPRSEEVLLQVERPYINHNISGVAFGPDGYLYVGFGDGGLTEDPDNNAQNTQLLVGSFLRLDVDMASGYAIPPDNPFAASPGCGAGEGCPEIFAWGFRNPWRFSFDTATGDLWAGDVGHNNYEEVNLVGLGQNYGWRCYEGTEPFNLEGCTDQEYTDPVAVFEHDRTYDPPLCAVTGGYVYHGAAMPELEGVYLYGDWCSGVVWGLEQEDGTWTSTELMDTEVSLVAFGQDADGEVYLVDYYEGTLHKLAPVTTCGATLSDDFATLSIPVVAFRDAWYAMELEQRTGRQYAVASFTPLDGLPEGCTAAEMSPSRQTIDVPYAAFRGDTVSLGLESVFARYTVSIIPLDQ